MTLIKSISGIRGTIGGVPGDGLSPVDVVKYTAAYAQWVRNATGVKMPKVVVGRDARLSGEMVESLVCSALVGMGCSVVNIGLATTPTTEIAVTSEEADGGIIITASHNPVQWNALKLLNSRGEFLSAEEGELVLKIAEDNSYVFADVHQLGSVVAKNYLEEHIQRILGLRLVDRAAIAKADFKIAFDAVNSVGGIAMPALLNALGVTKIVGINDTPNGEFAHTPEPLGENLVETCRVVRQSGVNVCFVVDPDVDRLSIVNEDGTMFGEEYTLVSVADYVLANTPGNTVSNMSSTKALRDITEKYGASYSASAVGEVNVVAKMKETEAVIGGEGNGGLIYPELHYGRDALVGIALFLSYLAKVGLKSSELRKTYTNYYISKNKIELSEKTDTDAILAQLKDRYKNYPVNDIDGLKIDFDNEWVHLRRSNTEQIIRIYAESKSEDSADALALKFISEIKELTN